MELYIVITKSVNNFKIIDEHNGSTAIQASGDTFVVHFKDIAKKSYKLELAFESALNSNGNSSTGQILIQQIQIEGLDQGGAI